MLARRKRCGFTLVELLLALGMVSVLLLLLTMSFRLVVGGRRIAEGKIVSLDITRIMLGKFRTDVRSLWRPVIRDSEDDEILLPITGKTPQSTRPGKYIDANADVEEWTATQITFSKLSRTVRGAALTGEVVQTVEWKWDAGSGKLTRRSALAFEAEDVFRSDKKSKKKTNSNISCQVDSARLEYFDGQRWLDKWDLKLKGRFPEKISLYLEFSEEESVKSYSVTTFPFIMESN